MKKSMFILVVAMAFAFTRCQKEESTLLPNPETPAVTDAPQVKSAGVANYFSDLILAIETLETDGVINGGNARSLTAKLQSAMKSLNKNNTKAFEGQIAALENEIKGLTKAGMLELEVSENLISKLKNVILLIKGSFVDSRDGREYQVVLIGQQIWMAENLAYLPAVYPSSEGSWQFPRYYVYDYNGTNVTAAKATANYQKYGVLYNWPAALAAAPAGWHLPSDEEWKQLEMAIGMSQAEADEEGFRGTQAGKLKAASGWYNNGNGTNSSGFTALPGGMRDDYGLFEGVTQLAEFWTSTEYITYRSWFRHIAYHEDYIFRWRFDMEHGRSVRCVKD